MAYNATVTTNTLPLRIRSGPSTSTARIGSIPKGASIVIDEIVEPGGGWIWGKLTYGGVSGYSCIKEPGVGTWISLGPEIKPAPTPPPPPPIEPKKDEVVDTTPPPNTDHLKSLDDVSSAFNGINGSGVQYLNERWGTMSEEEYRKYNDLLLNIDYNNGREINDINKPVFMQNKQGFPPQAGMEDGLHKYNYYMDYTDMEEGFKSIRYNLNRDVERKMDAYKISVEKYNRFKIDNPCEQLTKSSAHIFFLRPDLNILKNTGGGNFKLIEDLEYNASYYYYMKHSPELLRSLTLNGGFNHDFMFYLSNKACSFEVSDEYIKTDSYGDGYTGYKIPYGKHNIESKTSNTFNITYVDDRDLRNYQLHKIWIDYISDVYRGQILSKDHYIENKILDYATTVYYFLLAEDGETIIFWSAYYGVFPNNTASTITSWTKGNLVKLPEFQVTYTYAFKEDYNPLSMVEFNTHSSRQVFYTYSKTYVPALLSTGRTHVGPPFIETFNDDIEQPYTFKLRFRRG